MQVTINLTDNETIVVLNIAAQKELSPEAVFRQALRCYQLVEECAKTNPSVWTQILSAGKKKEGFGGLNWIDDND